jgi:pimeloyl-ACP methyl ester carboxylesterase
MPGFLLAMDALLSYDFRDRLGEIGCRTLIIHGEQDMLVPVEDAWEFRRLIPASRLLILQDTGHVPMLERPQTFNDVVTEFLVET